MKQSRQQLIRAFFAEQKWLLLLTVISGIASAVVHVLLPLSIGKFYDVYLHETSSKGALLSDLGLEINSLSAFFEFFFLLVLVRGILGFVSAYLNSLSSEKFGQYLLNSLFDAQMSQTLESHQSRPVAKYLTRYNSDMSSIRRYMVKGILGCIADVAFLLIAVMVLFYLHSTLAWVVVVAVPLFILITWFISKLQAPLGIARNDDRSAMLNFVASRLSAFFTIKVFNRENVEKSSFSKRLDKFFRSSKKYIAADALLQALLPLSFFLVVGGVMFFASQVYKDNTLNGSTLLVFVLLLLYMQGAFKRIMQVPSIRQKGKVSISNLLAILNLPTESNHGSDFPGEDFFGPLRFVDVSISFNDNTVIRNFSAHFDGRCTNVITGPQGSGKSTLLKLLLGMVRHDSGEVYFGETPLGALDPHLLRKQVTLCSDEAPLLGSTVFSAVSYSRKEEKRERVGKMLESLQFVIPGTSDVLDYRLEEGGKNLSQGQRKKLLLARALLTSKNVVLLDEPFLGMDQHAKHLAVEKLNKLRGKRTFIIAGNDIPEQLRVDKFQRL